MWQQETSSYIFQVKKHTITVKNFYITSLIQELMPLMCSHLAELQASPHVGHFSQLSPDAPGTEQTHRPHSHLPRPLQRVPSSDMHASVLVLQLQYSPVQSLSQRHSPQSHTPWPTSTKSLKPEGQKHTSSSITRVATHLRRAPHGSEHRSNRHTRSEVRRCAQSWMHDMHNGRSSTPPDHCISLTHY